MTWILVFIATLNIEILTYSLVSIWFTIGSVPAYIAYRLGLSMGWQIGIFIVASVIAFALTKPLFKKYLAKDIINTNVNALIGKEALVTSDIVKGSTKSAVIVGGIEWMAVSLDGTDINKDELVTIKGIQGAKLLVKKENKKEKGNDLV